MKNSILGKIIDENQNLNLLLLGIRQQIQALVQQLNTNPPPAPPIIAAIQGQIQALQNQEIAAAAQHDKKRSVLIQKIEAITNRRLLTYFSIYGLIQDRDSRIIEDFLISNKIAEFDILIDSPGGITDASEKMIKICRMRTGGDSDFNFRTIVVNQAKSAATLFALGSSKVLLSNTAELGPVDPQIGVFAPNGERVWDSAHQIYYGSKKFLDNSNRFVNFRKEGDLLLLSKYDPIAIKRAEVAINHTNDIINKRIYTNPNITSGYDKNGSSLSEELKIFTEHSASHSHGRPIYYENIKDYNFCKNKFIQKLEDFYLVDKQMEKAKVDLLQEHLWELTIRSLEVVRNTAEPVIDPNNGTISSINHVARKLFESSNGLILTNEPLN